jgi:hypothetical protein
MAANKGLNERRFQMFIMARKVKSKWYGIAACNGTCVADAARIFIDNGFPNFWQAGAGLVIRWDKALESQKNYGGNAVDFKVIA